MSADKYAQFIAEQQHKLSVSGTNAVELTEKKHMSKADIAALKEPKDKFDEKDLEALRNKEHLKKEEVEQIDEKKDSLAAFERRLRGQAGNGPKSEGNWSNTIKKQAAKAEADKKKSVEEEVELDDIMIEENVIELAEAMKKGELGEYERLNRDLYKHHIKLFHSHADMADKAHNLGDEEGFEHHFRKMWHHGDKSQIHGDIADRAAALGAKAKGKSRPASEPRQRLTDLKRIRY